VSANPFRDAMIRNALETLREIEKAVTADSNSTIIEGENGDTVIPGCPSEDECPPDVLRFRIDNAVRIFCAFQVAP
jgi:hypothetical protein